jgi:hypothetical protein
MFRILYQPLYLQFFTRGPLARCATRRGRLWGQSGPVQRTPQPANRTRGSKPLSFAGTSEVKALWPPALPLGGAQILGGGLAAAAVFDDVERDLLALVEGAQAGAFHGADMDEDIFNCRSPAE